MPADKHDDDAVSFNPFAAPDAGPEIEPKAPPIMDGEPDPSSDPAPASMAMTKAELLERVQELEAKLRKAELVDRIQVLEGASPSAPSDASAPAAPDAAPEALTLPEIKARLEDPILTDPVERQRLADLDRQLTDLRPRTASGVFDASISRGAEVTR